MPQIKFCRARQFEFWLAKITFRTAVCRCWRPVAVLRSASLASSKTGKNQKKKMLRLHCRRLNCARVLRVRRTAQAAAETYRHRCVIRCIILSTFIKLNNLLCALAFTAVVQSCVRWAHTLDRPLERRAARTRV